jgi:uncharacterized membrane protein YphA (DoxX/SURF4 family)
MSKNKNIVVAALRLSLSLLCIWGGVMHFTVPVSYYKNDFLVVLAKSNYLWEFIGVINIIGGILLLFKKYVLIGALILLPITVNIIALHIRYFTWDGIMIGLIIFGLNVFLLAFYKQFLKRLVIV